MKQAVSSISELVAYSEHVIINLDFADVSAIMKDAGHAHMGVGTASGRDKAEQAAMAAVSSPLLETSINGATGVLINITGSSELGLDDVETAANIVMEAANPDANIIFGAACDDDLEDEMRVTVIATGFDDKKNQQPQQPATKIGAYSAASERPRVQLSRTLTTSTRFSRFSIRTNMVRRRILRAHVCVWCVWLQGEDRFGRLTGNRLLLP